MNTSYASQYMNAEINLFHSEFHNILSNLHAFLNERQSILQRVAVAYHDALKQAKVASPESTFFQLRIPALERISTRITGGRFISYRSYEEHNGVAFMIDGKKVRIDIHEIDAMLSVLVKDEDTLNPKSVIKPNYKPFKSITYTKISTGGNIVLFDPYSLTVTYTPIEGIKPALSRTEHSVVGKFLHKQFKKVNYFGSQQAKKKITTVGKDGVVRPTFVFYGQFHFGKTRMSLVA